MVCVRGFTCNINKITRYGMSGWSVYDKGGFSFKYLKNFLKRMFKVSIKVFKNKQGCFRAGRPVPDLLGNLRDV